MIFAGKKLALALLGLWLLLSNACLAIVGEEQPAPTPTEAWSVDLRDFTTCSPALAPDGTIYFGSFKGKFWAITPTGSTKWVFQAGREIKSAAAVAADGTIYFGCRDRKLYALSAEGKKKWEFKTGAWVDSSPALGADALYFGSWDNNAYALTAGGSMKWQFKTGGPIVSSPALDTTGRIIFGSHDRKLYVLNPDGTKAWEYATGAPIISSPALDADGTVYFTSVDGNLYALNAEGGLKWLLKTGGITGSSPVIGQDGTLFLGVNNCIWAIDPGGKKKWAHPYGDDLMEASPVALGDGSVLFLAGAGLLVDLSITDRLIWAPRFFPGSQATPAIGSKGTIYVFGHVLNQGMVLYALTGSTAPAASPWPQFRANPQNTGQIR